MSYPSVVFAGRTFPAAREQLRQALPSSRIQVAELDGGGRQLPEAQVLIPLMSRVDGALMDRIPGLRLVHQWGAGLEGVDIDAATERGIAVGNVPSAVTGNADSVAEWCVMAALVLSRRLPELQRTLRDGKEWGNPPGLALRERTAGIVGLGGIGKALAVRLAPFGMRVIAVTRNPDPARFADLGLDWLGPLDELPHLLHRSDQVFLCLPLTSETRHLINAQALTHLRPTTFLINAGRGALIDEDALLEALQRNAIGGAALDVFTQEPLPTSSPLLTNERVLATPHIAGVTDLSYQTIAHYLTNVINRLTTEQPLNHCVNWNSVAPAYYRH